MAVKIRVAAFFEGSMKTVQMDVEAAGSSIKSAIKELDRKNPIGKGFFSSVVKHPRTTFLLNGNRIEPSEFERKLSDSDEISIVGPVAGG